MLVRLATVAVATPLVASLLATAWSAFWQEDVNRPVSNRVLAALHAAQFVAVALALVPPTATVGLVSLGGVYLVMAAGVVVLRQRRGSVPCGCLGASEHRLSAKLALFDAALGAVAIAAATVTVDAMTGVEALSAAGLIAVLGFVAGVVVPEGQRTIGRYRNANHYYLRWVQGFKELRGAAR